jgi:hypothetical protein
VNIHGCGGAKLNENLPSRRSSVPEESCHSGEPAWLIRHASIDLGLHAAMQQHGASSQRSAGRVHAAPVQDAFRQWLGGHALLLVRCVSCSHHVTRSDRRVR